MHRNLYECRKLADASSVENVHMVTEIQSQVFLGTVTSVTVLPPLMSVVPQELGAPELKGVTSYPCPHVELSPSNTFMHPTSPAVSP